jgi:hypothetical protein
MRTTADDTDMADEVVFMRGRMQEGPPGSDSDNEKSLLRNPDETVGHAVLIEQTPVIPKSVNGSLALEGLFCLSAVRFHVFPPYRDSRNGSTPKPGKEKQKSYDGCCAILMVHLFDPSFLCPPRYCVRA